jgi:GNAT superfamily N-acetyltransferase
MTQTLPSRRADTVIIRAYRPTDHNACHQLWAELASEHRSRYPGQVVSMASTAAADTPSGPAGFGFAALTESVTLTDNAGPPDPGAGFEEYLTRLDLSGMWVAQHRDDGVIGFVGLLLQGRSGAVDPVVVTGGRRGEGIGRALLEHVADQARHRGLRELSISPALRNVEAIHCLFRAGYDTASSVTLTLDLTGRSGGAGESLDLHGVHLRY